MLGFAAHAQVRITQPGQLGPSVVTTPAIADGTITAADISADLWLFLTGPITNQRLPVIERTATSTVSGAPSSVTVSISAHKALTGSTPRVYVGGFRWLPSLVTLSAGRDSVTVNTNSDYAFSVGDAVVVDYQGED
jgi:hypothetical protein